VLRAVGWPMQGSRDEQTLSQLMVGACVCVCVWRAGGRWSPLRSKGLPRFLRIVQIYMHNINRQRLRAVRVKTG